MMESLSSFVITAATGAATALQAAHSTGEARANARHTFESTQSIIKILIDTIWAAMRACTVLFVLLSTSLLNYLVIYFLYMPSRLAHEPLYFDYSCRSGGITEQCTLATSNDCATPSTSVCHPTARAHFLTDHTQWDPVVAEVAPKRLKSRLLKPRKRYYIDTVLILPESVTNRDLGVFMVQMDLLDDEGAVLARSSRPAMLPFEGYIVGNFRKLLMLPPLLIGALPEARRLVICNFNNFVEHEDRYLTASEVRIVIPRQSQFPDTPHISIELVRAEVHIGKELNLIQRTMKEWFYTSLFLGTFIILIFESITLFLAYLRYYDYRDRRREDDARNRRSWQSDPPNLADVFAQSFRGYNRRNEGDDGGEREMDKRMQTI